MTRRRTPRHPPRRRPSDAEPPRGPAPGPLVPADVAARRVAVRNPRGRTSWHDPRERTLRELREETEIGEVLLRSLTRAQLILALRVFAVFGSLLLGLPALFASHPALARYELAGIPLPWLILGAAVYPLLVLMGILYVRQAERHEREFVEIVERSS